MNYGFVVLIGLLVLGWILFSISASEPMAHLDEAGESSPRPDPSGKEWPVIAESNNETDIHPLKSLLESNDIPAMVETETPNTVEGAMSAIRNRLRVDPEKQSEAVDLIKDHDQAKFLVE